jgi:hypothetical protein
MSRFLEVEVLGAEALESRVQRLGQTCEQHCVELVVLDDDTASTLIPVANLISSIACRRVGSETPTKTGGRAGTAAAPGGGDISLSSIRRADVQVDLDGVEVEHGHAELVAGGRRRYRAGRRGSFRPNMLTREELADFCDSASASRPQWIR